MQMDQDNFFSRRITNQRADGKVVLSKVTKKLLYAYLCDRDGEKCNECNEIRKETENKLAIDHIENIKPTVNEKNGWIHSNDYQLLCSSCNSKKQRIYENEHRPTPKRAHPQLVGNTTFKANSYGIEEERERSGENSTEKSIRISKNRKDRWIQGATSILRKETKLKRKDLINYTISLLDQDGISIRTKSANGYLEEATVPAQYGGKFTEDEEGWVSLNDDL